jgi:hypothetical protein
MEKVFTFVYKFTYFKLFHEHVISLNFFKTIILDQISQTASSMNTRSPGHQPRVASSRSTHHQHDRIDRDKSYLLF